MKTWRPYKAGFILLYILSLIALADVVFTIYRMAFTAHDTPYDNFSAFTFLILVLVVLYMRMYLPSRVSIDGDRIRIAHPLFIKPAEGAQRAMFLYRNGDTDIKFMDKTFDLKSVTRYGWVEDLGFARVDKSPADENNKFLPVHEIAFCTSDNKRYHLNGGFFSKKQLKEIVAAIRDASGIAPEGKLAEVLAD